MSLTFRQTRYQALYKDVQRLIEDTASITVRGYVCIIHVISLFHTAVTGYERDSYSLITSHIIAYKRLCFISIFLLLFLWRLFSLPINKKMY